MKLLQSVRQEVSGTLMQARNSAEFPPRAGGVPDAWPANQKARLSRTGLDRRLLWRWACDVMVHYRLRMWHSTSQAVATLGRARGKAANSSFCNDIALVGCMAFTQARLASAEVGLRVMLGG
jgi:hypothetical protein